MDGSMLLVILKDGSKRWVDADTARDLQSEHKILYVFAKKSVPARERSIDRPKKKGEAPEEM